MLESKTKLIIKDQNYMKELVEEQTTEIERAFTVDAGSYVVADRYSRKT